MKKASLLSLFFGWVLAGGIAVIPAYGDISVKSSGVSLEDRIEEPSFSIKLVFFEKNTPDSGPFVTNVSVKIVNENNESVVEAISTGPWLFVDLPDGKYSVQATRKNGEVQSVNITAVGEQRAVGIGFTPE